MPETTTNDELLTEIGRKGDALWEGQIEREVDGAYVDIRATPPEDDYGPLRVIAIAVGLGVRPGNGPGWPSSPFLSPETSR